MKRRWVVSVVVAVLLSGCGLPADPAPTPQPVPPSESASAVPLPTLAPKPTVVTGSGRWLFMGDLFVGRYINDWSMASPLKQAYPFQNLDQFNRGAYTSWVANLECPSIPGLHLTSAQEDATLEFNCEPEYLPEIAQWFDAVSMANNHSGNRGPEGFATTQQQLAANGIQYFGSDDPAGQDCNVITLDVNIAMSDQSTQTWPIPFAYCGYDGVFAYPTADQVGQITTYSALLPTIAWPHSGLEYKASPDQMKIDLYRSMIDAGADMVIGNHAHWVQNTEAYHGKLIMYSIGNFIFDQQSNVEVTRSAMPDISFTVANPQALAGWAAIADRCRNDFATCQALAAANHLPRLQLQYTYGIQASNDADKLVKPATADQLAAIKARLQWDATMAALGQ